MEDTMNYSIGIRNFATMMNDVARIEEKKENVKRTAREYDDVSNTFNGDVNSANCEIYLAAGDRYFAAEKAYKAALTIFLKKYNTEKYSSLTYDVRYYKETRPSRMYEMIRDRMMRESRLIEFSI